MRGVVVILTLVALGCSAQGPQPSFADSVMPPAGLEGEEVAITISGRFHLDVRVSFNGDDSRLGDGFRLRLGETGLKDVSYVDASTLTAVVPQTLALGLHDLIVRGPEGYETLLVDAFDVRQPVGTGMDGPLVVPPGTNTVINDCVPLLQSLGDRIDVQGLASEPVGRLLFVWQVTDSGLFPSGDQTPIDDGNLGGSSVGRWERTRIVSVESVGPPTRLLVDPVLNQDYVSDAPAGLAAQVCTVPEYTVATVSAGATIEAARWNGQTGGFVGLQVQSTLDLRGSITALRAGFRGGDGSGNGVQNTVTSLDTSANAGGGKGEGLDASSLGLNGRGNRAIAGGGGNRHNAGGGGGGHGGMGGLGGKQWEDLGDEPNTQGMGGSRIASPVGERLFFGGGGGGGHANNSGAADGGRGGGVIMVWSFDVIGSGAIDASGGDGDDVTQDGTGGGGAGGTVCVDAAFLALTGVLSAVGGEGGDSDYTERHGPGGGGGGGIVVVRQFMSTEIDVSAGAAGTAVQQLDGWGATAGEAGRLEELDPGP